MTAWRTGARARRRFPLSVRLGTAFATVFLVVLTGLTALAYWGLGTTMRRELDRTLVDAAGQLGDRRAGTAEIDERELGGVESSEVETQLLDRSGRLIRASDSDFRVPLVPSRLLGAVRSRGGVFLDADVGREDQRVLARPLPGSEQRILVLAVERDTVADTQQLLLSRAGPLSAVAGLLAGLTGWLVARRGLAPMADLTGQIESLSAQDLSQRLRLRVSEVEVARLGRTLNEMLTRIEAARERERQFTADASHELRTPLSILRAEVELAREQVRTDGGPLVDSLTSALEECDRLGELVDDLLLIARVDAGNLDASRSVDVAEIAESLLPRFRVLAQRRGVSLSLRGDAAVTADPRALARALSNLLDNAVRHAADRGSVDVVIEETPPSVLVTVTDDGPGVPEQDRQRLTERFFQPDPSRGSGGGAGLGLAMVASVAHAHAGSLELGDAPSGQGLAVTLRLPSNRRRPLASRASGKTSSNPHPRFSRS